MGLEDRISFREALLSHRTEEEWRDYRPQHMNFYNSPFSFEGRQVTGSELIVEYSSRFPIDRDYSNRARLNRILEECGVPQFSFSDPEILRGFLLSAKTPAEWQTYEPGFHSFNDIDFQYVGIRLKGQMLLHNVFVELENKKNGTHYAFIDYHKNPDLAKEIYKDHSTEFITSLFELAKLSIKSGSIEDKLISNDRLKEILLSRRSVQDWSRWEGNSSEFDKLRFDVGGVRVFNGARLRRIYGDQHGRKYSAKDIFDDTGVSVASDPALLRSKKEDYFDRLYSFFDDPVTVRDLLLQVQGEVEWSQFQDFSALRRGEVIHDGRNLTLHTLAILYNIHKYNQTKNDLTEWITLKDAQNEASLAGIATSNKKTLSELLDFAGLSHRWRAELPEVDLNKPSLLKRLLFHAEYDDGPVNIEQIRSMNSTEFRRITFDDPETGLRVKGHALMLYYSAYDYWQANPEYPLSHVVQNLKKGKSNARVKAEIISRAGLR